MSFGAGRPLPPLPTARTRTDGFTLSERSNEVSVFSRSGAMEVNNGTFSAAAGDQYSSSAVQIVIHNAREEQRGLQPSSSRNRTGGLVRSRTTTRPLPSINRDRECHKEPATQKADRDSAVFLELTEQIRKLKELKEQLSIREGELASWEGRLRRHTQAVQAKEEELQRKEDDLLIRESEIKESQEGLDHLESLIRVREEDILSAMDDIRSREALVDRHELWRANAASSMASLYPNGALDDASDHIVPNSPLPLSPNRRHFHDAGNSSRQHIVPLLEGRDSVRVTHVARNSPCDPAPVRHIKDRHPISLPLSPNGVDQQQVTEREDSMYEFVAQSEGSTDYSLVAVGTDSDFDRLSDREMAESPPRYSEIEPNESPGTARTRPDKLSVTIQGPDDAPDHTPSSSATTTPSTSPDTTPNTTPSSTPATTPGTATATSFSGHVLREHVDDIEHMGESERADAISWAIKKLVETGGFDEEVIRTLCGRVSENQRSTNAAVDSLQKEIENARSDLTLLCALRLLRIMLANTTSLFREQCSQPHFTTPLENIAQSPDTNPAVRERMRAGIRAIRNERSELVHFALNQRSEGACRG